MPDGLVPALHCDQCRRVVAENLLNAQAVRLLLNTLEKDIKAGTYSKKRMVATDA